MASVVCVLARVVGDRVFVCCGGAQFEECMQCTGWPAFKFNLGPINKKKKKNLIWDQLIWGCSDFGVSPQS